MILRNPSILSLFSAFTGILLCCHSYSQERDLIQFSGVVVTSDSLLPVPFVNIIIKGTRRGTTSDYYGYFSFVAQKLDTILFSSVGFKKGEFIIPDTLTINRYSLIQVFIRDTILLQETMIYPWPTREQFRQAFMELKIPDDDLERSRKNLALAEMKEHYETAGMSSSENYSNYIQQQTSRIYYAGQYPPMNILNPLAWAQFIKAWKEGKLKIER